MVQQKQLVRLDCPIFCGYPNPTKSVFIEQDNLQTNNDLVPPIKMGGSYNYLYYHRSKEVIFKWLKNKHLQIEALWLLTNNKSLLDAVNYITTMSGGELRCGDNRDFYEYGRDLVASWFLEDEIKDYLEQNLPNYSFWLSGSDSKRHLQEQNVTNIPDFEVYDKNNHKVICYIELTSNFKNDCYENEYIHLRNNKYNHLLECDKPTYLLVIDYTQQKFSFISSEILPTMNPIEIKRIGSWGKSGYKFKFPKTMYSDFINLPYILEKELKNYVFN